VRVRIFIGRRQSESNESIREEAAMQVVHQKTPNGKTVEGSHIVEISILKVKIHSSRRSDRIAKPRRKKHKKMSFTDNITKNTTSSRVSNTNRGKPKRGKDQAMTKTATSISLNKLGSVTSPSLRPTPNTSPKKIPCSTS
jgi:phage protein D